MYILFMYICRYIYVYTYIQFWYDILLNVSVCVFLTSCTWTLSLLWWCQCTVPGRIPSGSSPQVPSLCYSQGHAGLTQLTLDTPRFSHHLDDIKKGILNWLRDNNRFMVSGINVAIEYLFGINVFQEMVPQEIAKAFFPSFFWLDFVDTWVIHVCETLVRYATRSIHTSTPRKITLSGWIHYQDEWYLELSFS